MSSTEPSVQIINATVIENSTTEPPLHTILTVLNLFDHGQLRLLSNREQPPVLPLQRAHTVPWVHGLHP